jgi:L-ascorbate metabolism protein UlaG (beta-lactamase superfamily)
MCFAFRGTVTPVDLLTRIRHFRPATGVTLWWLGQSGFVITSAGTMIVVDAYLTDHGAAGRRYPPPLVPAGVTDADLLVGTHDHLDHIDPEGLPAMASASPHAVVVVPAPVVEHVAALGVTRKRIVGAEVDVPFDSNGTRIAPIPALHAPTPEDGYGFHRDDLGRYPFLGYAFEVDGVRVCHLGDTLVYEGLGERLRALELDALLLPINGRSWYRERRGIAGNMNVFEAAELAAESGARCVVPVHWDLFEDNTEDPMHFRSYVNARCPSVAITIPAIGTGIPIAAASGGERR